MAHFRGCGGTPNRLPRAYHSGDSDEVDWVLRRMRDFVTDGTAFYGIADAAEDQYLSELVHRSATERRPLTSTPQAWSGLPSHLA